ncbi:MAG: hypothetical protein ACT4TC_18380 [Myxococcaceae bacterium]
MRRHSIRSPLEVGTGGVKTAPQVEIPPSSLYSNNFHLLMVPRAISNGMKAAFSPERHGYRPVAFSVQNGTTTSSSLWVTAEEILAANAFARHVETQLARIVDPAREGANLRPRSMNVRFGSSSLGEKRVHRDGPERVVFALEGEGTRFTDKAGNEHVVPEGHALVMGGLARQNANPALPSTPHQAPERVDPNRIFVAITLDREPLTRFAGEG